VLSNFEQQSSFPSPDFAFPQHASGDLSLSLFMQDMASLPSLRLQQDGSDLADASRRSAQHDSGALPSVIFWQHGQSALAAAGVGGVEACPALVLVGVAVCDQENIASARTIKAVILIFMRHLT